MDAKELKLNIEETLRLLHEGEYNIGRDYFNEKISDKYEKFVSEKEMFQLKMLLIELEDYLNDPTVKIVNAISLEELTKSFQEIKRDLEMLNVW